MKKELVDFEKWYIKNRVDYEKRPEHGIEIDKKSMNEFLKEYSISKIGKLTFEEYVIGTGNKSCFCNKIEKGKYRYAGPNIGGQSSGKFGIYYSSEKNVYKNYKHEIENNPEEKWKLIRTDLVSFLNSVVNVSCIEDILDNLPNLKGMSLVLTKLAFCFAPNKFICIASQGILKKIMRIMKCNYDKSMSAVKLSFLLNQYLRAESEKLKNVDPYILGYMLWDYYETIVKWPDIEDFDVSNIEKDLTGFEGKEKEIIIKQRINQGKYRENLFKKYGCKCFLCGVNNKEFLIASHIKPWVASDKNEKCNIYNGLLLCPNHDKLFDRGLITFDDYGKIIISNELDDINRLFLNVDKTMKINIEEESIKFMRYHRENIFGK